MIDCKMINKYLKILSDNGFKYKLTKSSELYKVFKYGEWVILMWSDFNDDIVENCEYMTTFKDLNYKQVERYAFSLLHYKIKSNYKKSYKESLRWYKKAYQGFIEPIPCHYIDEKLLKNYQRLLKLKKIIKK